MSLKTLDSLLKEEVGIQPPKLWCLVLSGHILWKMPLEVNGKPFDWGWGKLFANLSPQEVAVEIWERFYLSCDLIREVDLVSSFFLKWPASPPWFKSLVKHLDIRRLKMIRENKGTAKSSQCYCGCGQQDEEDYLAYHDDGQISSDISNIDINNNNNSSL